MYSKIMVPVDLGHADKLTKALTTAADLSKHYKAPVAYVGVTAATPSSIAHTPEEYRGKLDAFAKSESQKHGHDAEAVTIVSHDPTIDLDDELLKAVRDTGSDLVVMASHIPNLADYVWPSNGGSIAAHSDASVFVVR